MGEVGFYVNHLARTYGLLVPFKTEMMGAVDAIKSHLAHLFAEIARGAHQPSTNCLLCAETPYGQHRVCKVGRVTAQGWWGDVQGWSY